MPKIYGMNMTVESFWTMSQNKAFKIGYHERTIRKDSDAISPREVWTKDMDCDISMGISLSY
jgi:hypothetical protein